MGVKYAVDESYFTRWNDNMAYLLGYFFADGSLEDAKYIRGKYIRISSVDLDAVEAFKKAFFAAHPIVVIKSNNKSRAKFLLRIGSHRMYENLSELGLFPNKSLTITFPHVPKKYLSNFMRGYFDGDGCVSIERKLNRRGIYILKRLAMIFTSGSKSFLEGLAMIVVEELKINKPRVYKSHRSFQLRFSTTESIILFRFLYKSHPSLFLKRKLDIFRRYFEMRPERVDAEIRRILNGLVAKR